MLVAVLESNPCNGGCFLVVQTTAFQVNHYVGGTNAADPHFEVAEKHW